MSEVKDINQDTPSNDTMLRWQQSDPADPSRISILTLPAEIRTLIIEQVIPTRQRCVRLNSLWSWVAKQEKSSRCITNLLCACKQLHAEGASVFYGSNIFKSWNAVTPSEEGWSEDATKPGDPYCLLIRYAFIEAPDWDTQGEDKHSLPDELSRLVDAWPNLKTLTVELNDDEVDDLKRSMGIGRTPWVDEENIAQEIKRMWIACRESVPQKVEMTMHLRDFDCWDADYKQVEKSLKILAIDAGSAAKCKHGVDAFGFKILDMTLTG